MAGFKKKRYNAGFFSFDACLAIFIFSLSAFFAQSHLAAESSFFAYAAASESNQATLSEIADYLLSQEAACPCASYAECSIAHCIDEAALARAFGEKYAANPQQFGFSSMHASLGSAPPARAGQQCVRRVAMRGFKQVKFWVCGTPIVQGASA